MATPTKAELLELLVIWVAEGPFAGMDDDSECPYCFAQQRDGHAPDCPYLRAARIVEKAQR